MVFPDTGHQDTGCNGSPRITFQRVALADAPLCCATNPATITENVRSHLWFTLHTGL